MSGGVAGRRSCRAGKILIPGVISHATNVVEHPELVAERIVRFAELVGRENVMAGTDCGFAQSPFADRVHPSIMWAKLRALTKGRGLRATNFGASAVRPDLGSGQNQGGRHDDRRKTAASAVRRAS